MQGLYALRLHALRLVHAANTSTIELRMLEVHIVTAIRYSMAYGCSPLAHLPQIARLLL